jgi:hypothetical protein
VLEEFLDLTGAHTIENGGKNVSNSEMSYFFTEQGRTRVYTETYFLYVAGKNPWRTPLRGKMAIYGWTLTEKEEMLCSQEDKLP